MVGEGGGVLSTLECPHEKMSCEIKTSLAAALDAKVVGAMKEVRLFPTCARLYLQIGTVRQRENGAPK